MKTKRFTCSFLIFFFNFLKDDLIRDVGHVHVHVRAIDIIVEDVLVQDLVQDLLTEEDGMLFV